MQVRRPGGPWQGDRAPVVVFAVDTRWLGLLPGQQVETEGRLAPPRPGDVVTAVVVVGEPPRPIGRAPLWQRAAGSVRDGLRSAVLPLPPDERGLVPGLVLGDVSQMPPALTDAFRVTGLAHLNAVSGANVAIVLGTVMAAVRWTGLAASHSRHRCGRRSARFRRAGPAVAERPARRSDGRGRARRGDDRSPQPRAACCRRGCARPGGGRPVPRAVARLRDVGARDCRDRAARAAVDASGWRGRCRSRPPPPLPSRRRRSLRARR